VRPARRRRWRRWSAVAPPVAYERWRFALRERDLWIRRGILVRSVSVIPYRRFQFVDTEQGPLERWLGLARLVVYTAGVRGAQNVVPGLANRIAARWAHAVAVSVPGTRFGSRARVVVTGNPVRADVAGLGWVGRRDEAAAAFGLAPDRRTLFVFGGSQGARRLNTAVLEAAPRWRRPQAIQVLHAAGREHHEGVAAAWEAHRDTGLRVTCVPFVERMDLAFALADLVLCRAGASTMAELAVAGLPAILVPYPYAAADEQTANAAALADAGAAVLIRDADLDGAALAAAAAPRRRAARRPGGAAGRRGQTARAGRAGRTRR
jgi:UDP-N-acetylglucosamine--N-acetylmuramyl-(pentapeptide) pyrophosphoryl-undecaprenol N-acetylglucosamine transferase